MTFIFVQDEKQPKKSVDAIYLSHNSWDDYSYRLTFDAAYVDSDGKQHALGQVKVAFLGVREGTLLLTGNIPRFSEDHYSLGQSQSYYETIRELPNSAGKRILSAMRDIVLDEVRYKRVEGDDAFRISLMRYLDARKIESFRAILKGANITSGYSFSYSTQKGRLFELAVRPDSLPATNLHALIGRNGVGKTTLLANLAHAACTKPDELAFHPEYGRFDSDEPDSLFGNVVSVSWSAFDNFKVPTSDGYEHELLVPYDYIGLRRIKENRLKTQMELIDELIGCLKVCLFSARKDAWKQCLHILSNDPVFRQLPLAELADLDDEEDVERYRDLFSEMSTGHQIVLLSISRLVELVQDRTLVLYDEPECHLHPPLLASLIRAISNLLKQRNGVAIIATHSPVALQEVPQNCAWLIDRQDELRARPMDIETFGENVGFLTQRVFELEMRESSYYATIDEIVRREHVTTIDDVVNALDGHLGGEGKAIAIALLTAKEHELL
jgi:predicted ATPase